MLAVSRKTDEQLVIDRQIHVRLLRVARGRVRLGIDAPRGVDICRGELGPGSAFEITEKRMSKDINIKKYWSIPDG